MKKINLTGAEQILLRAEKLGGRNKQIMKLFKYYPFSEQVSESSINVILAGDFNVPSHLDWIEEAKEAHCNVSFKWPVSKFLEKRGFGDSYRKVNPNPVTHPGITWSPTFKKDFFDKIGPQPQDRIDFIYYKSVNLKAISLRIYNGDEPIYFSPKYRSNDWPSDHSAVVTEFVILDA